MIVDLCAKLERDKQLRFELINLSILYTAAIPLRIAIDWT